MTFKKLNLTAMILTYNEQINIRRALASIYWVPNILVVDSGSTDETLTIVAENQNAKVVHRKFDSFAGQCNFGLHNISTEWVISMDADYIISNEVAEEVCNILNGQEAVSNRDKEMVCGYKVRFKYCINGKPIRSGLLPERTLLYRKKYATYYDEGHGHRVNIRAKVLRLKGRILHDDRKDLSVWIENQKRYQRKEARLLRHTNTSSLQLQDRIRKHTCLSPFLVFLICFIIRGGVFDGREGVIYAFQRVLTETLLYLSIHDEECEGSQMS